LLRLYQRECLQAINQHRKAGTNRQLVVLATGLGKTVIAAHIPKMIHLGDRSMRALFLVHRDELVFQARNQLAKFNPDLTIGIEKADSRADDADIVVASIQTIGRPQSKRIEQFNPDSFCLIITDEAHHATANTYKTIYKYFRCLKGEPDVDDTKLFIGITATPNRSDNKGLESLYDTISFNYGIKEGIDNKWLCRIQATRVETPVDISAVRTVAGEFNAGELEQTINTPLRNELIARHFIGNRPEGPAFFFTTDIQHALDLSEVLRGNGVQVYPISGKTPPEERRMLMRLVNDGEIDGLASCGVLTEGIDCPRVQSAQMCRPYKSGLLYRQCIGRVLRCFPSPEDMAQMSNDGITPLWVKPYATVTDYVDVCGRHSLITTPAIFGLSEKFDAKGKDVVAQAAEVQQLQEDNPGLDLHGETDLDAIKSKLEKLKTSIHAINLLAVPESPAEFRKLSKLVWLKESEGAYHLGLMDGGMMSIREDTLGQLHVCRHNKGVRRELYVAKSLPEAIRAAESEIPTRDMNVMSSAASWRKEPCTEKQVALLYVLDKRLKSEFNGPQALFAFASNRYQNGDASYSRGEISRRIDSLRAQR
jgi:ATP-dependent helicase IRC3